MIKTAYIYINRLALSGVAKKPTQQAQALIDLKISNFDIYVLNSHISEKRDGVQYIKLKNFPRPFHFLDFVFSYNFFRYDCLKLIPLENYDYIILRYDKADKSGVKLCKDYAVITEHHTDEYTELMGEGRFSRSPLIKLVKSMRALLERRWARPMLSGVKGIIAISQDVLDIQKKKAGVPVESVIIPNGIGTMQTPFSGFRPLGNDNLHMVFPASHDNPYHGLDRLIRSIDDFEGQEKLRLHLVGSFPFCSFLNHPNVQYHGVLTGEALDQLMSRMNLGISTLAVFRRNISDPAALKTREFMARGLPFIIGYKDSDLVHCPPHERFFLEFPNDNSLIDFNKVISFLKEINSRYKPIELSTLMRTYAENHLDWKIKMKQYVDFIQQVDFSKKQGLISIDQKEK